MSRKLKQSLLSFATHGRPGSFWPEAELSSKQCRIGHRPKPRRTDVAEGVLLVSYIMHEIWPIGSQENHKIASKGGEGKGGIGMGVSGGEG